MREVVEGSKAMREWVGLQEYDRRNVSFEVLCPLVTAPLAAKSVPGLSSVCRIKSCTAGDPNKIEMRIKDVVIGVECAATV
jgi:hypothetical protein